MLDVYSRRCDAPARSASESSVDKRSRQFLDLVAESATTLLGKGFSESGTETVGAVGRRPYAVRVTFTRDDLEIASQFTLAFAGEEAITTTARRGDTVVFESSATAHKGQEIKKP